MQWVRRDEPTARVATGRSTVRALARGWRTIAATATIVTGLLTIASALTPNEPARESVLRQVESGPVMGLGHVLAGCAGIGLLLLGRGILRGQRRALDATIVLLACVALLHAVKGLDYEEGSLALALAAVLLTSRWTCRRGGALRPGLAAAAIAIAAFAGIYAIGLALALAHDHGASLGDVAAGAWSWLASGGWWLRSAEPVALVSDLLVVVGLAALATWLHGLMRPEPAADGHTAAAHARAAAIVARHGRDSLAPFLLREDKAFFFAHGGVLAYRTLRETAVVSGDPVGPPERAAAIVRAFLRHAHARGWDVVLTGAGAAHVEAYRALGLRALHIGNEAVVDPAVFSLEGRAIRKVRQSVNRVARLGWSIALLPSEQLPPLLAAEIETLEAAWRGQRPRLQGFAMTLGRLAATDPHAPELFVTARDPSGELRAYLRFSRYEAGLSLDVMRRLDRAPNGLNEALVCAALAHAREHGVHEVSLNFAGFAHVMAGDAVLTWPQRLLRRTIAPLHGRFQLERLVAFNEKFDPVWRPRYLVYGSRAHLPRAGLRVLQAEAYLRAPRERPLNERWIPSGAPVRPPVAPTPQPEPSR